jgi:hypothetical protein
VVLTDDLLSLAGTDTDMVLGVVGHELGHVRQRHGLRAVAQASAMAAVASALLCMAPTVAADEAGAPTPRLATGGGRTFAPLAVGLWRRRLGDLGRQEAHFLEPIERLGLAAHLEDSLGLLASAVHGNVVEFGHIGILVKSVSSEYPDGIR